MSKYSFVPAAVYPAKHSGLGIYVRHKGKMSDSIIIRQYRPNYIWLDCPDREILMVSDQNKNHAYIPMDCNYDEYFDLNFMNEYGNDDIPFMMFNYLQHENQHEPSYRRSGVNPNLDPSRKINYVADSGGFQLMTGKVEFIDPRKIANWYSNNIDMGMVLDIPIWDEDLDISSVQKLARMQKRNTEIIKDTLTRDVDLINIVHGISPQQKSAYSDIVFDESIDRMAIGGMYYQNVVFTTNQLYTFLMNNTHYKHIHVLGVYNVAQLAILIKLANSAMNNTFITSDASTPIQSARSKLMHSQLSQKSPPKRINIGDGDRIPSIYNYNNCQCKVCSAIKYLDVLASIDGATSSFMLAYHNTFEIVRMTRQMNFICANASHKEYKSFISGLLKSHRSAAYTFQAIDFIEYANAHGIESARKRYQHYLNISSILKYTEPAPLFKTAILEQEPEETVDDSAGEEDNSNYAMAMRLFEIYDKFHNNLETQEHTTTKKVKNREKDKKGSGRSSGIISSAGLKSQLKRIKKEKNGTKASATAKKATTLHNQSSK